MARSEARIFTTIWSDPDFRALDRTSQHVYFMALSQPSLNLCGVTLYVPAAWANNAADLTPKMIEAAVRTLVKQRFVVVDPSTAELWVRTLVKWDRILDKPNVAIAMSRDFPGILSRSIAERLLEQLGERLPERLGERFGEGFWERLAEPFRERFGERFGERLPDRVQPRAAARAEPPTTPQPTTPTTTQPTTTPPRSLNREAPESEPATGQSEAGLMLRNGAEAAALATRLLDACKPKRRDTAAAEAANVVRWALEHVDGNVVDEAIGWAASLDKPPALPRMVTATIRAKAGDAGIAMPEYDPRSIGKVLA